MTSSRSLVARWISYVALVSLAGCTTARVSVAPATRPADASPLGQRPDIVLILADDLGYSDLGCFGGEIHTPNLDQLARGGVRFTQFYNTPRCCPTRASLLTGVYPTQAGVGAMNQNLGAPGYEGHLNDRVATIAELLKAGGYRTGMVGKWHLSEINISGPGGKALLNREKDGPISSPAGRETWPDRRGFELFTGTIPGVSNFFDPYGLVRDGRAFTPELKDFYYTDFINDTASAYVREFAKQDKPFFLYVAHVAPHWPLHAKETDIAKYRDVYKQGWGPIRTERERRLREMKVMDAQWPMSPPFMRDGAAGPKPFATAAKAWETERMATYAAQVDCLDQGIGRLMRTLRETGRMDRTLLVFLSDNGACAEVVQANWYDIQSRTRDGREIRVGNDVNVFPGPETTWESYGPEWANVSNTPFRLFKHDTNEGGVSSPFILHWPGGTAGGGAAAGGTLVKGVGHVLDLMPTFLEVAGIDHPAQFAGKAILPMEGRSLWPLVAGESVTPRPPLFWEHEGHRGVRDGRWKMVSGSSGGAWELYDAESDRTELNNLARTMPDKVRELDAKYAAWAARVGVKAWPVN